jgi:ABC-type phosphate transport system substrate-binding protein
MKKILQICFLLLFFVSSSFSDEYVIVSNKNMKELSLSQVKAIFLKKLTIINDIKVVPVNLTARDPLRLKFEKKILRMNFSRLKTYWTKQHYLGHRPPVSMKSEQSVKAFLKKVDGSIGYMKAIYVDDDLKIIYKWSN